MKLSLFMALLLSGLTFMLSHQHTAQAQPSIQDYRVTRIRFYPRVGHAAEMKGGQFVGSLTSATNDFEAIVDIKTAPRVKSPLRAQN